MPQENDKSPNTVQFPLPLRLKKKTQHGQMTHQTKACKPQKTKMVVNSSSVVPRLHSWTLNTRSKGDRGDMVLPMRHCAQNATILF